LEKPIFSQLLEKPNKLLHFPKESKRNGLKFVFKQHCVYLFLKRVNPAEKGKKSIGCSPVVALHGQLHVLPFLFASRKKVEQACEKIFLQEMACV
jgi:hypothetical protein